MATYRLDRISEEFKKELAEIIRDLKDPRLHTGLLSVVKVSVTKDLKFAKAYVSVLGSREAQDAAIKGLGSAAGFIRKEIGHRLNLRVTPEFTFLADDSIRHGAHINQILHEILPAASEEDPENEVMSHDE